MIRSTRLSGCGPKSKRENGPENCVKSSRIDQDHLIDSSTNIYRYPGRGELQSAFTDVVGPLIIELMPGF